MKIIVDEPGRRLALKDIGGRLPFFVIALAAGLAIMGAVATGRWSLVDLQDLITRGVVPGSNGPIDLVIFSAALLYLISIRGGTRLDALDVDADQGRVTWRKSHVAGLFWWSGRMETQALDSLTCTRTKGEGVKPTLGVRLTLRAGHRAPVTLDFPVEQINLTAEIAEFALRLASVAGLPYYRVLRSDAHVFEMQAQRQPEPGVLSVPSVAGQADYAADAAMPAAKDAAAEVLPRFNPETFNGSLRVTAWEPGREVGFVKGWSKEVLLSPLLLGVLLPFLVWRSGILTHEPGPRIVGLAFFTLVGLVLALIGGLGLDSGWPRRVAVDWTRREIVMSRLRKSRTIAFSAIDAVELRRVTHRQRHGRGSNLVEIRYSCDVRLALRRLDPSAVDEAIVETAWCRDANEPYYMALPLAKELAAALSVEQRTLTA